MAYGRLGLHNEGVATIQEAIELEPLNPVHLITLGWITHSILGATYLAAPMALRTNLTAGKADNWACAGVAIGASGVIAHFWLEEYSGIAYSGGMLLVAFGYLALRVWKALRQAGTDTSIKWLVGCAYFNLLATAMFGTLLSMNKIVPSSISNVRAISRPSSHRTSMVCI